MQSIHGMYDDGKKFLRGTNALLIKKKSCMYIYTNSHQQLHGCANFGEIQHIRLVVASPSQAHHLGSEGDATGVCCTHFSQRPASDQQVLDCFLSWSHILLFHLPEGELCMSSEAGACLLLSLNV